MNDTDIELHDLTTAAHTIGRLKRKGICFHGWRQGPPGKPVCTCLDCGKTWPSELHCDEEIRELRAEYL